MVLGGEGGAFSFGIFLFLHYFSFCKDVERTIPGLVLQSGADFSVDENQGQGLRVESWNWRFFIGF